MAAKVFSVRAKGLQRVRNFIGVFGDQVELMASRHLRKSALAFARIIREIIKKQKYRWKPLSRRYMRYKKRKGLDRRKLIATKEYVNSIKATPRTRNGKIVSWGVTAGNPNQIHKASGLRFSTLARIHEHGSESRGIPARPAWRPAWSAFVRQDKKLLPRNIIREAYKMAAAKARGK